LKGFFVLWLSGDRVGRLSETQVEFWCFSQPQTALAAESGIDDVWVSSRERERERQIDGGEKKANRREDTREKMMRR
jgi:hypothetical protein